jgi:hypothetical protein
MKVLISYECLANLLGFQVAILSGLTITLFW